MREPSPVEVDRPLSEERSIVQQEKIRKLLDAAMQTGGAYGGGRMFKRAPSPPMRGSHELPLSKADPVPPWHRAPDLSRSKTAPHSLTRPISTKYPAHFSQLSRGALSAQYPYTMNYRPITGPKYQTRTFASPVAVSSLRTKSKADQINNSADHNATLWTNKYKFHSTFDPSSMHGNTFRHTPRFKHHHGQGHGFQRKQTQTQTLQVRHT